MTSTESTALRIDIVSDVVCPWCIVGYKQLEQAIAKTGIATDIRWQPFELNPEIPDDGENLSEHIQRKYGITDVQAAENRDRLTALGNELGFPFNFSDDMRMVSTFKAHQLLHWAATLGLQHPLKITLFHCFFIRGRDISDISVLANAAVESGLDFEEAMTILDDERYADAVREQERFAISNGIQGVPAVIFNQRDLVVGAQGIEQYENILQRVLAGD